MARQGLEQAIADSIQSICGADFVDKKWIRSRLSQFLRDDYRPRRSRIQRMFRLPGYPVSLPARIYSILKGAKPERPELTLRAVNNLKLEDRFAEKVAIFFRQYGLLDLGFPVTEVRNVGSLFAAALYRFAYAPLQIRYGRIEPEELWKSLQFSGVYRVFLKRVGKDNVEARILMTEVLDPNLLATRPVFAVEISKTGDEQWRVRCGPVAPSFDMQTIVLSDRLENDIGVVSELLKKNYDQDAQDKIDLENTYKVGWDVPILQAQDLQFYAVYNDGPNTIRGTFQSKSDIGFLAGRRLSSISTKSLDDTRMYLQNEIKNLTPYDQDIVQILGKASAADFLGGLPEQLLADGFGAETYLK